MDATETRKFQELHLRHVRGESLSETEQVFYQDTLTALEKDETAEVRAARERVEARIGELEAELFQLQERGTKLRAQLSGLTKTPHARLA